MELGFISALDKDIVTNCHIHMHVHNCMYIYIYMIYVHVYIDAAHSNVPMFQNSGDVDACYLHYLQALAQLDDAWGDPRKPGGRGHPFAAFLVWKL